MVLRCKHCNAQILVKRLGYCPSCYQDLSDDDKDALNFERSEDQKIYYSLRSQGGQLTELRTHFTDSEVLVEALHEMGFEVKFNANIRGGNHKTKAEIVAVLKGNNDLGFNLINGKFSLLCNLWCLEENYIPRKLIKRLVIVYTALSR